MISANDHFVVDIWLLFLINLDIKQFLINITYLNKQPKLQDVLCTLHSSFYAYLQKTINFQMDAPKQTYKNLQDFVVKTRKLLTQQQEAEKQDFERMTASKTAVQIQQQGAGLANMTVLNSKQGFYDRIIITLAKSYYSEKNRLQIPQHCKLQVGDDVAIYSGDTMIAEGIIYRRTSQKIKITVNVDPDDNQDFQDMKVNIILKWNQVTYRRYFQILDFLQSPHQDIPLVAHLFFKDGTAGYHPKKPELFKCEKMNQQQNQAIANGWAQQCHLIHGPPGTGKTTTVCQLIVQAVRRGEKVLACAPSNIAVDNIVQGISHRVNCVRVGNPARIINDVIQRCLDFLVDKSQGLWKTEEKKLNAVQKKLKRTKAKSQRKQLYGQLKSIRTQIQNLQQQVIGQILEDASVICCTNVGAADKVFKKYLNKRRFDMVVIDECGQGVEVSCWIPIVRGKRVVLAGDHKQLPPTVKFQQNSLLSYTLFSRCMEQLTHLTSTMLQVQYRMNKSIMGWSNAQFYDSKLKADKSVQNHTLRQIYTDIDQQQSVLLFVDTAGCQVGEEGGSMQSKMNMGQADIVTHIYKKMIKFGVKSKDIAILTPYSKQVTLIKNVLSEHQCEPPEVSTVDGIQGREKQCIIISLVRSNPDREIGFLKDWRRMNVAVTRARRMLIIVGDSDCVTADQKIKTLIEWLNQHGVVQSAEQLKEDPTIRFGLGKIILPGDYSKEKKQNETKKQNKKKKQKKHDQKHNNKKQITQQNSKTDQNKKTHSFQEQQDLKKLYRDALRDLKQQIVFTDFNAYQRKMMHEVAEEYGLQHITSEDKKKITIKPINQKEVQQKKLKQQREKRKKKAQLNKPGPQNLRQLIGEQSSEQQRQSQKQSEKQQNVQKNKKESLQNADVEQKAENKNKKKKNKKKQAQKQDQQDWEKLLDDFTADFPKNNECFKCKRKITSVTTIQCQFCKYYFCRHDVLAEEHGCEQEARQYARRGGNLDRYLEEGAKKIKQKLKEQQQQRRKKPKQNKQKDKKK